MLVSHLASFAQFLAHKGDREQADAQAMAELAARPVPLAPGLEVQWLGTAGYRITYEGATLLIDPYLSRVPLADVLKRRVALADPALHDRHLGGLENVVGVLVGHTHFDHAIDVPELTRRFGTTAYGSRSLVNLMALFGLTASTVEVQPRTVYELGPFTVRFIPSLHSKLLLGYKVPYDGELTCEHLDGLTPAAYRCGQVYGIHIRAGDTTLYHQGSANLIDAEIPRGGVDVFLAGIAGRRFTERYWARILPALDPAVVVASHFDDFFRPLDDEVGFATNVNLAGLEAEIAAVSRDAVTATLACSPGR